ncbi:Hypothetical protein HVPorG_00457 [Roseomonas mucosa]|uniref:DUF533 domain-containing protein n=1 Tax=Roseomonas mucosa TaxID=207340 RepID=UPI0022009774|nr:DUF533 domain-containing protein [Roseomonas mucosa]QDJ07962.1 Hypothetical protein HVPorG_00457 [Roseomonas mucosa]
MTVAGFLSRLRTGDGAGIPGTGGPGTSIPGAGSSGAGMTGGGGFPTHPAAAPPADPPPPAGRRQRALPAPETLLHEAVAQKLLHGWLQNRQQTLFPLSLSLRGLPEAQLALLAGIMAVSMLAGLRPPDEERGESPGWVQRLALLRGDEALPARIEAALHQPPPLSQVLREAQAAGLAAHAYVAALVVSDPRDETGRLFLDYLATRLALPPAMVRGAERRYRR